ncbi:hypothetical protein ViNHUV68_16210 [Vibrio sp. NH-UV-68]
MRVRSYFNCVRVFYRSLIPYHSACLQFFNNQLMKLPLFALSTTLLISTSSFADTYTYVFCGLPDGSDWDWLISEQDDYITIEGNWGRVTETTGRYFDVFKVNEHTFYTKVLRCPAGYIPQPADRGTSRWQIFEIIRADGSSYLIDAYTTYYFQNSVESNFQLRV